MGFRKKSQTTYTNIFSFEEMVHSLELYPVKMEQLRVVFKPNSLSTLNVYMLNATCYLIINERERERERERVHPQRSSRLLFNMYS